MSKDERREELKNIMRQYGVSTSEVASILNRSYGTVLNWRAGGTENTAPPVNELRLLKFELEARRKGKGAV